MKNKLLMFKNKIFAIPGITNLAIALLTLGTEALIRKTSTKEYKSKDAYLNAKYEYFSKYYGEK